MSAMRAMGQCDCEIFGKLEGTVLARRCGPPSGSIAFLIAFDRPTLSAQLCNYFYRHVVLRIQCIGLTNPSMEGAVRIVRSFIIGIVSRV